MTSFAVIETKNIRGSAHFVGAGRVLYYDTLELAQEIVNTMMQDDDMYSVTLCAVLEVKTKD
jgi:hypothetical protein